MTEENTPTKLATMPIVNSITWGDIASSLKQGMMDFINAPLYGLLFGAIFAGGGVAIVAILTYLDAIWMTLPIAIGFPLIGPFVAAGLYEVSRRLDANQKLTWVGVLFTVFQQRERQMGWMAFVVLFIFWIWIYQIRILIALFLGFNTPSTLSGFVEIVFTTQAGLLFLMTGTIVGAVLALFLFAATVIAMPLLLDTELDFVTAMITSFKSVSTNLVPMIIWGLLVTLLAILAMIPAFLGLIIVFPILGHATWHLYTKTIERPWA